MPDPNASEVEPVFLTAQWRNLLMLNYPVDASVLDPLVPDGTELDLWNGTAMMSLVGFQFLDTRVKGIPIPFHRDFEEINLRFYVRRKHYQEWRRGVVFVKEIVPRRAIATVANLVYGENYVTCDTKCEIVDPTPSTNGSVAYGWVDNSGQYSISAALNGSLQELQQGSEEEFIAEHYWGYSMGRDARTTEYRVEHPTWRAWSVSDAVFHGDGALFYGAALGEVLTQPPQSGLVADGSDIIVRDGRKIHQHP